MTKNESEGLSSRALLSLGFFFLIVLFVSAFFFFRTIGSLRNNGIGHPPRNPLGMFLSGERPVNGSGMLEGWMTFDFVNTTHHLPPEYLKNILHIEDSRYPNIPIGRYAKDIGFKKEDFIGMVQRALDLYKENK